MFHKYDIYDALICDQFLKGNTMKKNFQVQGGYYYDTLAEAIKEASRIAARTAGDIKVYQAVKLVSPKAPEVDVTDVVIS